MQCSLRTSSALGLSVNVESRETTSKLAKTLAAIASCMTTRVLAILFFALSSFDTVGVELEISPERSTSGTFNLSWQGEEGETYRLLQLSEDNQFQVIYQGEDTARVMTGLPNGDYIYQVEGESGSSEPRTVTVAHHSLIRAFSFFGIGLVVFLATILLVVRGSRGR